MKKYLLDFHIYEQLEKFFSHNGLFSHNITIL